MAVVASFLDEKLAVVERARAWRPRVISKLEALIQSSDPWDLYRVNPVRFAIERGIEEGEAVDLFLHATKAGLFRMEWQLLCPSCSDTLESFSSLSTLHNRCFCNLCHIETEARLDDYIRVSFSLSPEVSELPFHHPEDLPIQDYIMRFRLDPRARIPGGPTEVEAMGSTVRMLSYIDGGRNLSFDAEFPAGAFMGHDFLTGRGFFIPVEAGGASQLEAVFDGNVWKLSADKVAPGIVSVGYRNGTGQRMAAMATCIPPDHAPAILEFEPGLNGNKLLNSQTFRSLYRTDTLPSNEGIGVRDLALVFTDLKGSTALYERIGDLKAFALVQQHFEHLTRAVQTHNGAIVKTIGDAVMASFENAGDAVAAALDMLREIAQFNDQQGGREILLKIGIHRGPSIAVTLNDRLDYFGQTVNIAARVQGLAEAEEICITEGVWKAAGVQDQLIGYQVSEETAILKGITSKMPVRRVSSGAPPSPSNILRYRDQEDW